MVPQLPVPVLTSSSLLALSHWTLPKLFSLSNTLPFPWKTFCSLQTNAQGLGTPIWKPFLIPSPLLPSGAHHLCFHSFTVRTRFLPKNEFPLYTESTWTIGRDLVFEYSLPGTEQDPCERVNEHGFIKTNFWFMAVAIIFQA